MRLQASLTAAELTKEVTADDLEGLRAQALDAVALLGESSKDIEAMEASGDAGHKEVWGLEGRLLEEETFHCKLRREPEAGLCAGEEEARKLDAMADGLLEEALRLQTELAEGT